MHTKKIAIIGGGMTGLSAAYYLLENIREQGLAYEVKLFEGSSRLGGKIHTLHKDGFVIERGADSFLARKQPAVNLVKKLGLEGELVRNGTGQAFVLVNGKLHKIPKGSYRGIPTKLLPYWTSSMFSLKGKLRGTLDLILPKGKKVEDESLGRLFRRRFGNEFVDYLIEPLLAGIYSGDIDEMSVRATLPELLELEQKYGSLTKGLEDTLPKPSGKAKAKRPGAFFSLKSGLGTMISSLAEALGDVVLLNTPVDHIEKKDTGYNLLLGDGTVYQADTVLLATEHETVPKVLSQYDFLKSFTEIPSTSTANVALAFDQSAIKKDIDGTGFVISRKSDTRITACTWTHKKWPDTTPKGKALVRCYVGKPNDQEVVDLTDDEIIEIVLRDLNKTMKIKKDPEFAVITRWPKARPQYTVGHVARIQQAEDQLHQTLPGVYFAGSSYKGVGIPDCIEQAEEAVKKILGFLQTN